MLAPCPQGTAGPHQKDFRTRKTAGTEKPTWDLRPADRLIAEIRPTPLTVLSCIEFTVEASPHREPTLYFIYLFFNIPEFLLLLLSSRERISQFPLLVPRHYLADRSGGKPMPSWLTSKNTRERSHYAHFIIPISSICLSDPPFPPLACLSLAS